jgi:hypothetical protein
MAFGSLLAPGPRTTGVAAIQPPGRGAQFFSAHNPKEPPFDVSPSVSCFICFELRGS